MSFLDDKLVLTDCPYLFHVGDYGRTYAYKLYDRTDAAFDASTYTGYIKIYTSENEEAITEIASNANASGVGSFAFTSSNRPDAGRYILRWVGEKSGVIRSFTCINQVAVIDGVKSTRTP